MGDMHEKVREVLQKMGIDPKADKVEDQSLDFFYKAKHSSKSPLKKVHKYEHQGESLIVVPLNDLHLGHKGCNIPLFEAFVEYILNTPNAVTILNGDLAETATKISVGKGMFEEDFNLPKQLEILEEILEPLAKAGKILGMGPGNHEERVTNMIGLCPMKILADKLGVPYFGYQGYFRVAVSRIVYKIAVNHGVGGGSSTGGKSNSAEKMNRVVLADLYLSGHTHGLQFHQDKIYIIDEDSDELKEMKRTYVVSGSFLEYFGGYSEMKVLPPSITGTARIELRGDMKDIRVTI